MTNPVRIAAAILVTTASVLVLVLAPGARSAYAANLMGPLRAPGEAAFIAAHRGDRAGAPENTVPAFESAVRGGSDFLETDVQLTADGYPVLMHDASVDRTTSGSGLVADLTLAELRTLDAGSWYAPEFAGVQVPLFTEFLDILVASPEVTALVELKDQWSADDVETLMGGIYFRGVQDRIVFAAFSPNTATALQEVAPLIPRVILRRVLPIDPVEVAGRFGAIAIMTRASALEDRPDAVAEMHAAGLGILLYTLNSEKRWSEALSYGVDGIVTDEPSALDEWIAATAPGT